MGDSMITGKTCGSCRFEATTAGESGAFSR
jgi:hypothetical protein